MQKHKSIILTFFKYLLLSILILGFGHKYLLIQQFATGPIKYVWFIQEENQNWTGYMQLKGNSAVPYMNNILLPISAHAEQFYTTVHPSLPNYIWNESGSNQGVLDDNPPSAHHFATTTHLTSMLQKAGFTWKTYAEGISGTNCPITNNGSYAVRHVGVLYFDDVTNGNSATSQNCITHVRPYSELASNLSSGNIANFNYIVPNLCDDMHGGVAGCGSGNLLTQGDTFLKNTIAAITATNQYKTAGAIIMTFDEGHDSAAGQDSNGPIPAFILSPFAKANYSNTIHYTHSSTIKTVEEIFGVTPLLGDPAIPDLADLFKPGILSNNGGGTTVTPTINPTNISHTTTFSFAICPHGIGKCGDNANPTSSGNINPIHTLISVTVSVLDASNTLVTQKTGTLHFNSGDENFFGQIDMGNLTSGNYLVSVKANGYLSKQFAGIQSIKSGQDNILAPQVFVVSGDINNDNQLDILDYNILVSCFGSKQNTSGCTNPPTSTTTGTDINDDGAVNGADYNLFLRELSVQKGG